MYQFKLELLFSYLLCSCRKIGFPVLVGALAPQSVQTTRQQEVAHVRPKAAHAQTSVLVDRARSRVATRWVLTVTKFA